MKKQSGIEAILKAYEKAGINFNRDILNKYHKERVESGKQEIDNLIASLEAENVEREIDRLLGERNFEALARLQAR